MNLLNDYPYTYATRVKENNLLEQQQQSSAEEQNNVSSSSTIATTDGDVGLSWKLIGEDINVLPEFTTENVLQYFIYRKKNDGLERQDWKNFNSSGFKLFKDGHIQKVSVSDFTTNVYVKATCLPEMNKDRTYSLFITI